MSDTSVPPDAIGSSHNEFENETKTSIETPVVDATPSDDSAAVNETDEKKRKTNKSTQQLYIEEICKKRGIKPAMRHQTVSMSLLHSLNNAKIHMKMKKGERDEIIKKNKEITGFLFSNSISIGTYRYWVSVILCEHYLHATQNDTEPLPLTKNTFDRLWSAIDRFKNEKDGVNEHDEIVERFFKIIQMRPEYLPDSVSFELRSPTARDMALSTKLSIVSNFFTRIQKTIRNEIDEKHRLMDVKQPALIKWNLSNKMLDAVIKEDGEYQKYLVKAIDIGSKIEIDDVWIKNTVLENRSFLTDLRSTTYPIAYTIKKEPHRFLKYMCFLNRKLTATNARYYEEVPEEIRKKQKGPSKPFSIISAFDLQPAFIELARTQMNTLFGKKNIDDVYLGKNIFSVKTTQQGKQMYKWLENPETEKPITVTSFQTNGVMLSSKFITPKSLSSGPKNIEHLVKKGYDIPVCKKFKADEDIGVCKISEKRIDVKRIKQNDISQYEIIGADPGVNKPITCCRVPLDKCADAKTIKDNCEVFSYTNDEYQEMSGFKESLEYEKSRRLQNARYQIGIEDMLSETRKTSNLDQYYSYFITYMKHYNVFFKEKMLFERSLLRWSRYKKTMKALSLMANKVAGTEKNKEIEELKKKKNSGNYDEIKLKIKKLRDKIAAKKLKRIVCFGAGVFRCGGHGHAPIPLKKLVRYISCRVLCALTNEDGTSKYCPGCGCEMEDVDKKTRTRSCTNSCREGPSVCALRVGDQAYVTDRDDCGALGITICGSFPLTGRPRPKHYCRSSEECFSETIQEEESNTTS